MVHELDGQGKKGTNKDCWRRKVKLREKEQGNQDLPLFSCPQNEVTTLEQRQEEGKGIESTRE